MYDLRDKVALVTGASGARSLGREIAVKFAEHGANVVVSDLADNASASWGGLPAVADEITSIGRDAIGVVADVTDSSHVKSLVESTIAKFGRIDILVNNAGAPAGPDRVNVLDLPEDVFDRVMTVNVRGTFLVSQAVARQMIEHSEGGKIINMSSLSGLRGKRRFAAYCSSKFAIIGFTQSLAHELAPFGINVNAICPGLIDNDRVHEMAAALRPDGVSVEEFHANMIERGSSSNPLGRLGTPDDVASAALWLASDESSYVTGESIRVTGGDELK